MFINLLILFFLLLLFWQFRTKVIEGFKEGIDEDTYTDIGSTSASTKSDCSVQTDVATLKSQYSSLQKQVDDLEGEMKSVADAQTAMVSSIPTADVSGADDDGTTNPDGSPNTEVMAANANSAAFFNTI